mmetsp:Transcript_18783/g.33976  ORF Transcript_18783/g.33976 Transcript_18783/m.33976 type:complete len:345 (-) Transcript_18783:85-1119(-)
MRQRFPQSYLFMSHVIARCDGNGPSVIVTEGSGGFIVNRIRALFKMNQGYHFQVWVDDTFVGVAQEIGQHGSGVPSILFRNSTGATMGSSTLQSRHFHGSKDEWLVTNEKDTKIPFYANAALTLNYAFHIHNHDVGKKDHPLKDDKPSLEAIVGDQTEPEQATPEESNDKSTEAERTSLASEVPKSDTLAAEAEKEPETVAVPTEEGQTKVVTEDVDQGKSEKGKDEPKPSKEEPTTDKTAESQSKSEEKAEAEEKKWEEKGREEEAKGREKGREEEEKYRKEEQEYRHEERSEERSNREQEEQHEQAEEHAEEKEHSKGAEHEEPSTAKDKDSSKEQIVTVVS